MRAIQITSLDGPSALSVGDVPEPDATEHPLSPGERVLIDVEAAAVSFPDVLQTRGLYQYKPDLPFVPGAEVAGTVVEATEGCGLHAGDRVMAATLLGGMAERAIAPPHLTFALPERLSFEQGAAFPMNYHTAWFSLHLRGALAEGETVLVHGAAGGVGTAAIQVAKALGAERVIAVVSGDAKAETATRAGADEVVRSDGPWKDDVLALGGADVVLDPVGGDRFTDSLRCLKEDGRLIVVGFAGGAIPEVKVNRLLLGNTSVVGAGWGAYAMGKPGLNRRAGAELGAMIEAGTLDPVVGAALPLDRAAEAMRLIDEREALGKVVLITK